MSARIVIDADRLPGYTVDRQLDTESLSALWQLVEVFDPKGKSLGHVIYAGKTQPTTHYGWRPYGEPRAPLTDQVAAVEALIAGAVKS